MANKQHEELFVSSLLKSVELNRAVEIEQVAKTLLPKDLDNQRCSMIYETTLDLIQNGQPYKLPDIASALYDKVAPAYISELSNWDVTAHWQLEEFAAEVARASQKRKFHQAAMELSELARNDNIEPTEAFDMACAIVAKVEPSVFANKGYVRVIDLMPEYLDQIETLHRNQQDGHTISGYDTQKPNLNAYTNGLQRNDLIILAAPPSVGKTAFMLDLLLEGTSIEDQHGLMFSLEMAKDKPLRDRMISNRARIDSDRLRTGLLENDDWPRLTSGIASISDRFYIDDSRGMTLSYIKRTARQLRREIGKDAKLLICIDYLQRLPNPPGVANRNEGLGRISAELKDLAIELGATVIAISSLKRGMQDRSDKRPTMSDLRDSGEIEFNADLIWFLYRNSYYDRKTTNTDATELIIDKHRNGPTGTIMLSFVRQFGSFLDLAKE